MQHIVGRKPCYDTAQVALQMRWVTIRNKKMGQLFEVHLQYFVITAFTYRYREKQECKYKCNFTK